ncbi:hypothetical protein [Halolamina sp. CBA1230]|uniref:hypothetical protein n=1 Tax=Halolamina sp. CBA1230 TaxID=1853690 RepID=UPI0020D1E53C|nr:hypothetical protein [Halolamina sp. CBA1230]
MGDDGESEEAETGEDPRRRPPGAPGADDTVPRVDLALRELSVSVTGRSDDDLETVEESARDLMGYLVEEAGQLEDEHDEYGLS